MSETFKGKRASQEEVVYNRTTLFSVYNIKEGSPLMQLLDKSMPITGVTLFEIINAVGKRFGDEGLISLSEPFILIPGNNYKWLPKGLHLAQLRYYLLNELQLVKEKCTPPRNCSKEEFEITGEKHSFDSPYENQYFDLPACFDPDERNLQITNHEFFSTIRPFLRPVERKEHFFSLNYLINTFQNFLNHYKKQLTDHRNPDFYINSHPALKRCTDRRGFHLAEIREIVLHNTRCDIISHLWDLTRDNFIFE